MPEGGIKPRVNPEFSQPNMGRYGHGEHGIAKAHWQSTGPAEVLIISVGAPFWGFAAPVLGRRLVNVVCLTSFSLEKEFSNYFAYSGIRIWTGKEVDTKIWKRMLEGISIVLVSGNIGSWMDGIWRSNVGTVVCSKYQPKSPIGWNSQRRYVSHRVCGGVTNARSLFVLYTRQPIKLAPIISKPARDLRSILKMAVYGRKVSPSTNVPCGSTTGSSVMDVSPGILHACGLMENTTLKPWHWPRVRTKYGGTLWVDRYMDPSEKLMACDVPEEFVLSMDTGSRRDLTNTSIIPVKMMQSILELLSDDNSSRSRSSEQKVSNHTSEVAALDNDVKTLKEKEEVADERAVKRDDATAQVDMWWNRIYDYLSEEVQGRDWRGACQRLTTLALKWWKRAMCKSCLAWMKGQKRGLMNSELDSIGDCLRRIHDATWWEWPGGSTPFFWNWPDRLQVRIREGLKPWMHGKLIPWHGKQPGPPSTREREMVAEKLSSIVSRRYVVQKPVTSMTSFFHVSKGKDDIRMVYDGTKCGLNAVLWAPWFPLPNVNSLSRLVEPGTWLCDNDCGEMFLNFVLHWSIQELCGVDFTKYLIGYTFISAIFRWARNAMGLRPSPYNAVHCLMWAKEIILGNRHDENNVFRWTKVQLNLPGSDGYDPTKPWVFKARMDGVIAADIVIYVDDMRPTGPSLRECWLAAQKLSSGLASLGVQDASRKRRMPSQTPGAWAGAIIHTDQGRVVVTVSQERWEKAKGIIDRLHATEEKGEKHDYKQLESDRGFLLYVGLTFPLIKTHLKGIHSTLASHHPNRDVDGWKILDYVEGTDHVMMEVDDAPNPDWRNRKPPKQIKGVGRLLFDLEALKFLTESPTPPKRMLRASHSCRVVYGFGDASGLGFGSAIEINGRIWWRGGQWIRTLKDESSNFRELANLVIALEEAHRDGLLQGSEVFMFTDNSVAERAYFRGTSSSRLLFDLILRLKRIESTGLCIIHLIHVSGKRMIKSGVDGLSRGDQTSGVMRGSSLKTFVPIHLSAIERSPKLMVWISSWAVTGRGTAPKMVTPTDWPTAYQRGTTSVWFPPPAAGEAAVEYLANCIHLESCSCHVVVMPRLMTAMWHRKLRKATDLHLTIPLGSKVWNLSQLEPLMLFVYLPLSTRYPWRHKGTQGIDTLGRELQGMWTTHHDKTGPLLRKLLDSAWSCSSL